MKERIAKELLRMAKVIISETSEETSEQYFINEVFPIMKRKIGVIAKKHGFKIRGRGKVNKRRGMVELIFESPVGELLLWGSYMTPNDWNYSIIIQSSYFPGDHEVHDRFTKKPAKDAQNMLKDLSDMFADWYMYVDRK